MKITEQTTLAELTLIRAKLGLTHLSVDVGVDGNRVACIKYDEREYYGYGKTEAAALQDAVERSTRVLGAALQAKAGAAP